jgi:hypothetical protein
MSHSMTIKQGRTMLETIHHSLPWLGGGATATIIGACIYLWSKYFNRADRLLDDIRRDRDYWREMAMGRQETIHNLQATFDEQRRITERLKCENVTLQETVSRLESVLKKQGDEIAELKARPWYRSQVEQ